MIEKVKTISNPLTIIAIFAGLAEVAGTVALATVSPELQRVFVWFVMIFPFCLVCLFFFTLNFNPKVLYAPSDFRNDDNFLRALASTRHIAANFEAVVKQLDASKNAIVSEAVKELGAIGELERNRRVEGVEQQMALVRRQVAAARVSVNALLTDSRGSDVVYATAEAAVMAYISRWNSASLLELVGATGVGSTRILQAVDALTNARLIERRESESKELAWQLLEPKKSQQTHAEATSETAPGTLSKASDA